MKKGKSINGLMKHIRVQHKIKISGSKDKKLLLSMGYYHGYKGYKFNKNITHPFTQLANFNQILAIADFDEQMKANMYPLVMKFENIIKNVIINQVVDGSNPAFDHIYKQKLTYYRTLSHNTSAYHNAILKRLRLKKIVDERISTEYGNQNKIIAHYIENYEPVPLWALFEILTLGNIGQFMWTLNIADRNEIAKFFNLYDFQYDPQSNFIRQSIFIIKDLRNALAHNHIIFDCRFKSSNTRISNNIKATLKNKLGDENHFDFKRLVDYLALVIIFLKESGSSVGELKRYIRSFENTVNDLYLKTQSADTSFPYSIYNEIIGENFRGKITAIKNYVNS